jgi:hypothetical protein
MLLVWLVVAQLSAGRHWPPGARVAVWVDIAQAPTGAAALVERAMKNWSDASNGQLTLIKAATRPEATIRITFVSSDHVYGEAAPRLDPKTGFIAQADIAINNAVPDDPLDARIVVYLTALHELGHAIGLPHSDTFSAIMYRFRRVDDGERYFGAYRRMIRSVDDVGVSASHLDPEDIRTLQGLYAR